MGRTPEKRVTKGYGFVWVLGADQVLPKMPPNQTEATHSNQGVAPLAPRKRTEAKYGRVRFGPPMAFENTLP